VQCPRKHPAVPAGLLCRKSFARSPALAAPPLTILPSLPSLLVPCLPLLPSGGHSGEQCGCVVRLPRVPGSSKPRNNHRHRHRQCPRAHAGGACCVGSLERPGLGRLRGKPGAGKAEAQHAADAPAAPALPVPILPACLPCLACSSSFSCAARRPAPPVPCPLTPCSCAAWF
jgi:hypothetical protein